jgi:hypothetical protein
MLKFVFCLVNSKTPQNPGLSRQRVTMISTTAVDLKMLAAGGFATEKQLVPATSICKSNGLCMV